MNPKPPVYERMRSPIRPSAPKAFNRPIIRVVKWRKVADHIADRLDGPEYSSSHGAVQARACRDYIQDWIEHAEGILNGRLSPDTVFLSPHALSNPYLRTPRWDPHHVHPVLTPFDYTFNDDTSPPPSP